jgi:hypothetical protein
MNNNDPHKTGKKINHEKEKKESIQKKKENHEKGNFPSLEPFFCLLVFGQDKIQRGRERERERTRSKAQSRERTRSHERTSERESARAIEVCVQIGFCVFWT